jgi:hypothetical protein
VTVCCSHSILAISWPHSGQYSHYSNWNTAHFHYCYFILSACVQQLEEGLKEKEKACKDASDELQQWISDLEEERRLRNRCDKTIQGLIASLHEKEKEVIPHLLGFEIHVFCTHKVWDH